MASERRLDDLPERWARIRSGADAVSVDLNEMATYGTRIEGTVRLAGEALRYLALRCAGTRPVSVERLVKLLWKAEMRCYTELRVHLTGSRYLAEDAGPTRDGVDELVSRLVERGAAAVNTADGSLALRVLGEPDVAAFSAQKLALLDAVVDDERGRDDDAVAAGSRGLPWRLTHRADGLGAPIPYELQWIDDTPLTNQDKELAEYLFEKHGIGHAV